MDSNSVAIRRSQVKCDSSIVSVRGLAVLGLALACSESFAVPIYTLNEKYVGYYEYDGRITQTAVKNALPNLFPNNQIPQEFFIFNIGDPVHIEISAVHILQDSSGNRPDLPGFYRLSGSITTPTFYLNVDDNLNFGTSPYSPDFSQQNPGAYFCCALGGHEDAQAFWNDKFVHFDYFPTGDSDGIAFTAEAVGIAKFFPVPEPSSIFLIVAGLLGMGLVLRQAKLGSEGPVV